MIIAIDGYEANDGHRVGIGRYAYEILRNLCLVHPDHYFRVYLPNPPLPDMPVQTDWWQYRVLSPKRLWTFFRLPLALATDVPRANVVFSPTHYIPRFIPIPRVMSIMDLSYIAYPEMFRAKDLYQLVHWTRYSVEHAEKILTISQFSRDAIIKEYGVTPQKLVVTYPGLTMTNSQFTMTKQNLLKKYHLASNYILSVGTLQPRKNFVRLIEAFSQLSKQYPDLELVIVGKRGWLYEEILAAPKKYRVAQRVKILDFLPGDVLPAIYAGAMCFALPSLYEGFGLPVLEAMACGCPVVVSNVSSLPEVAGEVGIYVDPLDVRSIAKGIRRALAEYRTKVGNERVRHGKELAKQFTWEKAARKTLAILEEVGRI